MLFLFCVALCILLLGVSCWVLSCSCFYSPFSIDITSLGQERAGLCASRAFVGLFCTCYFCPFSLPLGWLRLMTVALPGLFINPFASF